MNLTKTARTYLALVAVAAMGCVLYTLQTWHGSLPTNLALMALLVVLAAVAVHFPLTVLPGYKVDVVPAVEVASLILFGTPVAVALMAASQLVGQSTMALRHLPSGKRRANKEMVLFNASQHIITLALGGLVYYGLLPQVVPASFESSALLLALPAAGLTMYVANSTLVAIMAGMHRGRNPFFVWRAGWQAGAVQRTALTLIGVVTAMTSATHFWAPLAMVAPAVVMYLSLKQSAQLIIVGQTISAVEAMADVVDMRDNYTFQHSKRVAEYSVQIARQMRLPARDVETIRLAARVHDLGKIGVPDHVLNKPGKLTPEEWELMEKHVDLGYEILSRFSEYQEGKELVRLHHERFDGSGYPRHLTGDRQVLGAQIIAVADALDAMTSDRPYRKALPLETAVSEFRRLKGVQWNPVVVDALEQLLGEHESERSMTRVRLSLVAA